MRASNCELRPQDSCVTVSSPLAPRFVSTIKVLLHFRHLQTEAHTRPVTHGQEQGLYAHDSDVTTTTSCPELEVF